MDLLPLEILDNIMYLATHDFYRYPIMSPRHLPLLFLRVSRLWRDRALRNPRLWNRLDLRDYPKFPASLDTFLDIVVDWICRSGAVGIDFQVGAGDAEVLRALFKVLRSCIERWKKTDIHIYDLDPFMSILQEVDSLSFPMLQSLCLCRYDPASDGALLSLLSASNAPCLRSLNTFHIPSLFIQLNHAALTHLELAAPRANYPVLLSHLTLCTSLTSLNLASFNDNFSASPVLSHSRIPDPSYPIRLPVLKALDLHCKDPWYILQVLDVPNLDTLTLVDFTATPPEIEPASLSFGSVRTFEITILDPASLAFFVFPDLRVLKYHQLGERESTDLERIRDIGPSLITMLKSSVNARFNGSHSGGVASGVTELEIGRSYFNSETRNYVLWDYDALDVLKYCPDLSIARLKGTTGSARLYQGLTLPSMSETIVHELDPPSNSIILCPRLKEVYLYSPCERTEDEAEVVDLRHERR